MIVKPVGVPYGRPLDGIGKSRTHYPDFRVNYFAHGAPFVDRPYFLAGTAVPDWLGVADRSIRVPPRRIHAWADADDPIVASIAQGILQHHDDDARFHVAQEFNRSCFEFSQRIQGLPGFQVDHVASLLAHVTIELLLDASLIESNPDRLNRYYQAMELVDGDQVAEAIGHMTGKRPASLSKMIAIFRRERFLEDYQSDDRLCFRLSQVFRRIGFSPIPDAFRAILPWMREVVEERREAMVDSRAYQD